MTLGQQQDLTECLDNVMDMLETALKSRKRKREDSRDEAVREREGSEGQAENTIKT
jgi:ribosome-associated translation inhibitor RaiA